jgi:hypothetical protein
LREPFLVIENDGVKEGAMKRFRFLAITVLLVSIQLIAAGCRGTMFGEKHLTYVNEKDTSQFIEFEAAQPSLRSWWNNLPIEPRREGNYIRTDGKQTTSGSYSLEGDAYLLKSSGGLEESRYSIQADLNLKDDRGDMWRRQIHVVLEKKALVSVR